jgi:hypothetical protein
MEPEVFADAVPEVEAFIASPAVADELLRSESWQQSLTEGTAMDHLKLVWALLVRLWSNIMAVPVDPWTVYAEACSDAATHSWHALKSWGQLLKLIVKPFYGLSAAVWQETWPVVKGGARGVWRWQTSRSLTFILAELSLVLAITSIVLLQRYIARTRYVSRTHICL